MIRAATGILAALVLVAVPASAEWVVESIPATEGGPVNPANDPVSLTQNQDTSTVSDMVACANSGCTPQGVWACTTENHWGRTYNLDAVYGINSALTINSVDVGHLLSSTEDGSTNTLEVNLYEHAGAFSVANTNSIGGVSVEVPGDLSADGTLENIAVAGVVNDPTTNDLAVEQFSPQDGTAGAPFRAYRAGGNGGGEFADSYLYSESCALTDWTAFGAIGFGTIHLLQVVNGKEDADPTPTSQASWGEIKGLYSN